MVWVVGGAEAGQRRDEIESSKLVVPQCWRWKRGKRGEEMGEGVGGGEREREQFAQTARLTWRAAAARATPVVKAFIISVQVQMCQYRMCGKPEQKVKNRTLQAWYDIFC